MCFSRGNWRTGFTTPRSGSMSRRGTSKRSCRSFSPTDSGTIFANDSVTVKEGSAMTPDLVRGDVVYVDLSGSIGGEKQNSRPCVVVQNNKGNEVSPLTIVVPITDVQQYKRLPVQVQVCAQNLGHGGKDSVIECGHVRTIG